MEEQFDPLKDWGRIATAIFRAYFWFCDLLRQPHRH